MSTLTSPRRRLRQSIGKMAGAHIPLIIVAIIFAVPVLALIAESLKTLAQNTAVPPQWIPNPFYWGNYSAAVNIAPFAHMLLNTVIIVALQVVGVAISSALIGYGFSVIRWRGQGVVFMLVIATMLIPYEVTLIPQYILFSKFGWLNTFYPLFVPYFFGIPIYIFLFRQFFLRMPVELSEAGRIDGASELRIFTRIYLPLARPALLVVALLQFVAGWNDFLGPLIYLNDKSLSTLVLGMEYFRQNQYQVDVGGQAAYSIMIVAPVVFVFFLAQRRFIEGMTLTAMKG
ncbi:MAG TPA: carbohydrate ABC transporter permease [Mycobacteriales bacterium]|jgi:multiple sugar transport system permease protein|nr:carbohydrate ABC transporter permease [Mycobacteriales bacterium]